MGMVRRQIVGQTRESVAHATPSPFGMGVVARLAAVSVLVTAVLGLRPLTSAAAGRVTVCGSGCDRDSIAVALTEVSAGGTIEVLDAEHTEGGILVDKDVTIAGLGASESIVQAHATHGEAATRVFEIAPEAEVTIQDLTVRHGNVSGVSPRGGGILNHGMLTLERVAVVSNQVVGADGDPGETAQGGGVYSDGDLTVIGSTLSSNTARGGDGPSHNDDGGDGQGGALFIGGGSTGLVDVTISANSAHGGAGDDTGGRGQGGGVYAGGGSARLLNVTISGNGVRKGYACGG